MKRIEIIKNYYNGELREDPERFEHLGWESREAQFQRFSVLTDYIDLNGKHILDVGCGLGHLVEHLEEKKITMNYTGLDILSDMTKSASQRHKKHTFISGDIFLDDLFEQETFDIIYCSGIFNLNVGNNTDFLNRAVTRFHSLARETIVFNLLHKNSPQREEKYYYFYPDQVIRGLEQLPVSFKSIQLVEHYLNNDFTLILNLKDGPHCSKNH
jgi:ubiquinone/menaquinone biosynthesis C-methylase UbiE